MIEPNPIDHKDEVGDYRHRVREYVFERAGGTGHPVSDPAELVGEWDVTFLGVGQSGVLALVYHLRADGSATVEPSDGSWPASSDEWRLNQDGTFSLLTWCPADPDYGIDEPQLDEDRRHLAALADGRLVTWNGDGSSAFLLTPRPSS
ncbi:MAG: hypothetical protein WBC44_20510 [Planctomycetaceae bacterium]